MPSMPACPSWLPARRRQGSAHTGGISRWACATHRSAPLTLALPLRPLERTRTCNPSPPHATCRSVQPLQRHPEVPISQQRRRSCAHSADLQALPDAREGAPPALLCYEVPPDHIAPHALLASSPPPLTWSASPSPLQHTALLPADGVVCYLQYKKENRSWSD